MVGILVSFWDGLFSGAILVLGRVHRFLFLSQGSCPKFFRLQMPGLPPNLQRNNCLHRIKTQRNHSPPCPSSFAACLRPNRIWTMPRESASCPEITTFWAETPTPTKSTWTNSIVYYRAGGEQLRTSEFLLLNFSTFNRRDGKFTVVMAYIWKHLQ